MKNSLVLFAFVAAPFSLTGCSKSCEDLEREMEKLSTEANSLDDAQELAELGAEYAERCLAQ